MEASRSSPAYENRTIDALKAHLFEQEKEIHASGVKGSYFAYLLARMWLEVRRTFLVVTGDNDSAAKVVDELHFFLGGEKDRDGAVRFLPAWETLPYDTSEPQPEKIMTRLETLYCMETSRRDLIVVTPLRSLLQRCVSPQVLERAVIVVQENQAIDRDELIQQLGWNGYRNCPLVEEPGEFSVRGGIVDVFSPLQERPARIEFYGDIVDSIRFFNPTSQRSLGDISSFSILPVSEVVLDDSARKQALNRIEKMRKEDEAPAQLLWEAKEKVTNGCFFPGISFLLDLFYKHTASVFEYFPEQTMIWLRELPDVEDRIKSFCKKAHSQRTAGLEERKISSLGAGLYDSAGDVIESLTSYRRVWVNSLDVFQPGAVGLTFPVSDNRDLYEGIIDKKSETGPLAQVMEMIRGLLDDYYTVVLVTYSDAQKTRFREVVNDGYGLALVEHETFCIDRNKTTFESRLMMVEGDIQEGFRSPADRLVVITEAEIFGERRPHRKRRVENAEGEAVSTLQDLIIDDFVVHVDYGIGRYGGLHSLNVAGSRSDFLLIEYRDDDRLYVPVHRLNLVQKYRGAEEGVPALNKLGGKAWERTKKKISESIKAHAKELLNVYAARMALNGHSFSSRDEYYREFEAGFEFEETPDQIDAIEDVLGDMESTRPMDRLVCGDTGYGKTEVALRAAFKAVTDNKQVAILVPTTVLAHQHYQTFSRRLRDFPMVIGMLSRFQSPNEQKRIIKEAREGKVDILIGTHRLLQKDVAFKDLGLVMIDEEHRFGVRHKEGLKKMRALVDVLTLTATPIPRTLQLSLLQIRDLSIINSPPENRLSVKTYITRYDEKTIREAVIREFMRDGQVFFVHNRVERIEAVAEAVRKIVPESRMAIAHGQMREKDLENVMMAFHRREINLLLCTSIIESGLDFPAANTIIINRADQMGLAQLYQLRGRVGRSNHQAYAYFLIPGERFLSAKAKKRLQALADFSELGSGFRLANYDLEMRGGGNILGLSQSGNMNQVGIELYYELIDRAVKEVKGEKALPEIDPEIKVHVPAYISEDYVPDVQQRLQIYKRLAGGMEDGALSDMREEMRDRYGPISEEVENLFLVSSIKRILKKHLIRSMELLRGHAVLAFHPEAGEALEKVLALLDNHGESLRFTPDHCLHIPISKEWDWGEIVEKVRKTLG